MKIFISHSSKDKFYGDALVKLLTGLGIQHDKITYTSNDAYGIPNGKNIFDWLKSKIQEEPHVIYLLSPEYYKSVACLNEMGAAWMMGDKRTIIFTPGFDLDKDFIEVTLDPRKMGIDIDKKDKLLLFVDDLKEMHGISPSSAIVNQKLDDFLDKVKPAPVEKVGQPLTGTTRFYSDLRSGIMTDAEVLLIRYALDEEKFYFGTGLQEEQEIEKIKIWEAKNKLNDCLSTKYATVLKRYIYKRLLDAGRLDKQLDIGEYNSVKDLRDDLMDRSREIESLINSVVYRNKKNQ